MPNSTSPMSAPRFAARLRSRRQGRAGSRSTRRCTRGRRCRPARPRRTREADQRHVPAVRARDSRGDAAQHPVAPRLRRRSWNERGGGGGVWAGGGVGGGVGGRGTRDPCGDRAPCARPAPSGMSLRGEPCRTGRRALPTAAENMGHADLRPADTSRAVTTAMSWPVSRPGTRRVPRDRRGPAASRVPRPRLGGRPRVRPLRRGVAFMAPAPDPEPAPRRAPDPVQAAALGAVVLGLLLLARRGTWSATRSSGRSPPPRSGLRCCGCSRSVVTIAPNPRGRPSTGCRPRRRRRSSCSWARSAAVRARGDRRVARGGWDCRPRRDVGIVVCAPRGLSAAIVVIAGLALVIGPGLWRLAAALVEERRDRIRSDERERTSPRTSTTLCCRRSRSCNGTPTIHAAWYARPPPGARAARVVGWRATTRRTDRRCRARQRRCVGRVLSSKTLFDGGARRRRRRGRCVCAIARSRSTALVGAIREGCVNAASTVRVDVVSVFVEGRADGVDVFVRDRGRGFDADGRRAWSRHRRSIEAASNVWAAQRPSSRRRHRGTEVHLVLPRARRRPALQPRRAGQAAVNQEHRDGRLPRRRSRSCSARAWNRRSVDSSTSWRGGRRRRGESPASWRRDPMSSSWMCTSPVAVAARSS